MINFEVRNRLGVSVHTFGEEKPALAYAAADPKMLGPLTVWAVEHITRERQITEPSPISFRGAGGLRVGGRRA